MSFQQAYTLRRKQLQPGCITASLLLFGWTQLLLFVLTVRLSVKAAVTSLSAYCTVNKTNNSIWITAQRVWELTRVFMGAKEVVNEGNEALCALMNLNQWAFVLRQSSDQIRRSGESPQGCAGVLCVYLWWGNQKITLFHWFTSFLNKHSLTLIHCLCCLTTARALFQTIGGKPKETSSLFCSVDCKPDICLEAGYLK